jgi:hypothetical protein
MSLSNSWASLNPGLLCQQASFVQQNFINRLFRIVFEQITEQKIVIVKQFNSLQLKVECIKIWSIRVDTLNYSFYL